MAEKKKRAFVEHYYTFSEDEMQEIVAKAKSGDTQAQNQLLETFSNFLAKYVTLLYHGRYSLSDYDIRQFFFLYVNEPKARMQLRRNKITAHTRKEVQKALTGINFMVVRYGDQEDVEQTVRMAFLQAVERYERRGDIPFSGYVYRYFFYVLKKLVDEFLIDQLGRKTLELKDENSNEEGQSGFAGDTVPAAELLIGPDMIDEYWVAGDTCMWPFTILTVQERQLLRWRYNDGLRSSEIAHRITEHPNTSREHLNRIRQKLADAIASDPEL